MKSDQLLKALTAEEVEYITQGLSKKRPVIVGMSGGVDSSLTAALLHSLGFQVRGVTLQLHSKSKTCCSSVKDVIEAKETAEQIGIQHHAIHYVDRFNSTVMKDFINNYHNGYTPSPCILCNQYIKFDQLLSFSVYIGAQAMATGHYIKHVINDSGLKFAKAKDHIKDQTYFMSTVRASQVEFMRFPLGIFNKTRVRELSAIAGLRTATKKDSQDLCFVQNGTYRNILNELAKKTNKGIIRDIYGNVHGMHDGIHNYTVGQRKGLDLPSGPWFVIDIIADSNEVVIGRREELLKDVFNIDSLNLLYCKDSQTSSQLKYIKQVKIRSRNDIIDCEVHHCGKEIYSVHLSKPTHSIAPGQFCAFYDDDILVGGGRIVRS